MTIIRRTEVGDVLARIYDAEISARLEWLHDGGFVWALLGAGGELPRVLLDDALAGEFSTQHQSAAAAESFERGQFLRPDWQARGRARTIEEAVTALADAIAHVYVAIPFADWWSRRRKESTTREE